MEWYASHTWIHKPPLFTWQMALGMKVFGTSLQGMRSASVFMFLLLGVAIYRSVKLFYPRTALWGLLIIYTSPILLFLVNGRQGMDHNDIAFISWTSMAFWAFVSYAKQKSLKYVLALGAACGAAMLTKWLAGSLLIFTTGLYLLLKKDFTIKSWIHLFTAGCIAALIFLPWQLYQYHLFPDLFLKEWKHNSLHLFEVVEGHFEPWYFHLTIWEDKLHLFYILFIIATVSYGFISKRNRSLSLSILLSIIAVMLFYSLASTKLPAFTLILIPYVSFLIAEFLSSIKKPRINLIVVLTIAVVTLNNLYVNYYLKHDNNETISNRKSIRELGIGLRNTLPNNAVIFNAPAMMYPDIAFFSHRSVYEKIPTPEEVKTIRELGKKVYILTPKDIKLPVEIEETTRSIDATSIQAYYSDLRKNL